MKVSNLPVIADMPNNVGQRNDDAEHANFSTELGNKITSAKHKHDSADRKHDKPAVSETDKTTGRIEIDNLLPLVGKVRGGRIDKNSEVPEPAAVDLHREPRQLLTVQTLPQPAETLTLAVQNDRESVEDLVTGNIPEKLTSLLATAEKSATDVLHASSSARTADNKTRALFTLSSGAQKMAQAVPVQPGEALPEADKIADNANSLTGLLAASPVQPQVRVSKESEHQDVSLPVQLPAHAPSSDAAPRPSVVLSQALGTPVWQNALSQQVSLFTRNGIHNAELRLHPQELGSVQINLRLNNDQVQLHFVTENHQVRAAMEAAMPHLRTTLAESGLQLEHSSVGQDTSSSGGFFSQSEHEGRQDTRDSDQGNAAALPESKPDVPARVVRYASGINTFA